MPVAEPRTRRWTRDEYYKIGQLGLFDGQRVELIEGEIIDKSPIGNRHAACLRRLIRVFSGRLGARALIDAQDPVELDVYSMPQPDFVLLRPRADDHASAHPTPEDVLLLVEIADATLRYDEKIKAPLYFRTGVRESWIVDLEHQRLLVFHGETLQTLQPGDMVAPLAFPDEPFAVSEILGLDLGQ
jgi:Uma2 family endonuclease